MWEVCLALLPAFMMAIHLFGGRAAVVVVSGVLGAAAGEALVQGLIRKQPVTLDDGSAVVTGMLLGFCVPSGLPWWTAAIGGFVATVLGKQAYGGLGQNIFNPAHCARAFLLAGWPLYMTTWIRPGVSAGLFGPLPDGITGATPLAFLKETMRNPDLAARLVASGTSPVEATFSGLDIGWQDLLLGTIGGSLGETCKVALLVGALFLLVRRHIGWQTPVAMVTTVFLGTIAWHRDPSLALFQVLSGGLVLGAFFMATDMVTSPMTRTGQAVFGVGCGAITLLIRNWGAYPEGVCYSILIMNAFVPLIDNLTVPSRFGEAATPPREART